MRTKGADIRGKGEKRVHFAILRAAMEVFSEKGFAGADIDAIADRAGLNTAAVCRHFRNKRQLFVSVVDWGEYQLMHRIHETRKRCTPVPEIIEHTLRAYFRFFEKRVSFFRVLVQEKYNFYDEMHTRFKKLFHENLKEFEDDIRRGIAEGVIRDVDPHACALMVQYIASGLFLDWMHSDSTHRVIDLYKVANDFISHALLVDNKRKSTTTG